MADSSEKSKSVLEKLAPILLVSSIALAFVVGVLWQKVSNLEGGGAENKVSGVADPSPVNQPQAPAQGKLTAEQAKKITSVSDDDHIRGDRNSKVFLIEYSDYQCPFCTRFHETAKQVIDEYSGKVAWVYRHFPLDQLHKNARPAAEASECLAKLVGEDSFWEFSDKLYKDQTQVENFSSIALSLGVNKASFEDCIESQDVKDKVQAQYQSGLDAGVTGTPGNLIVNDKGGAWFVPGALPFEQLKVTIDEALAG